MHINIKNKGLCINHTAIKKEKNFVIYQDVLTTALLEVSLPGAPVSWTRTCGRGLQQALSLWWTTRVNQTRPAQGDSLGQ